MRRGLAWAAGLAGILTAFLLRRRRTVVAPAVDPAAELRAKLAAARASDEAPAQRPAEVEAEPAAAPVDADERRRDVHAQARAAIDEMRGERPD